VLSADSGKQRESVQTSKDSSPVISFGDADFALDGTDNVRRDMKSSVCVNECLCVVLADLTTCDVCTHADKTSAVCVYVIECL
jgi:hypothetical protein